MLKDKLPDIREKDPTHRILQMWEMAEVANEMPLSRSDLAQIAGYVMAHYMLQLSTNPDYGPLVEENIDRLDKILKKLLLKLKHDAEVQK